ncbi:hypothetical protein [Legionella sp. CNM-4043-24]|uniref:hypothetical protein n=1 Tax=Legionella sp. CNM-4043-24 TaxID=3421646 RepID=UPI00403B2FC6
MQKIEAALTLFLTYLLFIIKLIARYIDLNTIQNGLFATASAGVYAHTLQQHYQEEEDIYYAHARAAGAVLKVVFPLVFIPTLRVLNHTFHQLSATKPIAQRINRFSSHKVLATGMMVFTGIHATAHILNTTQRDNIDFSDREWLTGFSMVALVMLPVGGMYFLRNKISTRFSYYSQFLLPHQLGWWGLTLGFGFHTNDLRLLPISLIILSGFTLDRLLEWSKSSTTTVHSIESIHQRMMVLTLKKPQHYQNKPGDYAMLAAPWFSYFFNAVHPFTIASGNDDNYIRFIISENGVWTRQLIKNLTIGSKIQLTSSFPSHLTLSKFTNTQFMLITSGSGLAMTAAFLNYFHSMSIQSLYLAIYHSTREIQELRFLLQLIRESKVEVNRIQFNITATSKDLSTLENLNIPVVIETNRLNPQTNVSLKQFKGHLFFCGNNNIARDLQLTCQNNSEQTLHIEHF